MRVLLTVLTFGIAGFFIYKTNSHKKVKVAIGAEPSAKLTLDRIEQLPGPVMEWLKQVGAVGCGPVKSVYLKQSGQMKLKPEQERWIFSEAEQYSLVAPPAFYWRVKMKLGKGFL